MADLKKSSAECLLDRSCRPGDFRNAGASELCLEFALPAEATSLAAEVEMLYVQQHDSLYRFLISTGCPPELAPDLLQEGFCRLFENLRAGKAIEKPRSWLVQVLYNLFLNHVRKHRRETELDDASLAKADAWRPGSSDPETEFRARQREELVQHAMLQLTPAQSRYLSLRAEGLKFREIAESCGVATATVAESCARALQKIRTLINE